MKKVTMSVLRADPVCAAGYAQREQPLKPVLAAPQLTHESLSRQCFGVERGVQAAMTEDPIAMAADEAQLRDVNRLEPGVFVPAQGTLHAICEMLPEDFECHEAFAFSSFLVLHSVPQRLHQILTMLDLLCHG